MKINFVSCEGKLSGVVLAPVMEGEELPSRLLKEDKDGLILKAVKADNFTGKKGQTCVVFLPNIRIIFKGIGPKEKLDIPALEKVGGELAAQAKLLKKESITVCTGGVFEAPVAESTPAALVALGFGLGAYTFDVYKAKKEDDVVLQEVKFLCPDPDVDAKAFEPLSAVLDGVYEARDLVSEPSNMMTPAEFVDVAESMKIKGLDVDVLDAKQMKKRGLNLLLGVGKGSVHEPYLLVVKYMKGKKNDAPLLLVGKGVCFDSGGISLKPGAGMGDMKYDMAGAAAVLGTMMSIAKQGLKTNVVGIMPLVENMPSGGALKPGDVVQSMSGKTVEIVNTDAEGRLILADAVWYGQEEFKPDTIIDLATLTGAVRVALGSVYAGLFSNNEELAQEIEAAAKETPMDHVWELPLHEAYNQLMDSDIADVSNLSSAPEAGPSTAAHFINRFIQDGVKWAHLDIASMAWTKKDLPCAPKGATGFGVQLLTRFIQHRQG